MINKNELNQVIANALSEYPTISRRWQHGDPTVVAMLSAMRDMLVAVSMDAEQSLLEPFIKSRPKTIMADAIIKGILPVASACQHYVWIKNTGNDKVTLSAGRLLSDNLGRQWRLLSSVSIATNSMAKVLCEQSFMVSQTFDIKTTLPFYGHAINAGENDSHIAGLNLYHLGNKQLVRYTPKFMNAHKGELVYTLDSTDFKTLTLMFGDTQRVGQTARAGDSYRLDITYSDGFIDVGELKQAILSELFDEKERGLKCYFFHPDDEHEFGLVRQGSNPPTLSQLRLLAGYPESYDDNAVYLGNFDMLVRKHYASRFDYMAVWNETIHERHYGVSLNNINHLNLCVVAKNAGDQQALENDIKERIARADSLFAERVRLMRVARVPYRVNITGNLSGVHDLDEVISQIKGVLLANYGRGSVMASRPNADGFNRQEMARLIYDNVPAFADRISDFTVVAVDDQPLKPHEWAYLTQESITVNLNRSADNGTVMWGL